MRVEPGVLDDSRSGVCGEIICIRLDKYESLDLEERRYSRGLEGWYLLGEGFQCQVKELVNEFLFLFQLDSSLLGHKIVQIHFHQCVCKG